MMTQMEKASFVLMSRAIEECDPDETKRNELIELLQKVCQKYPRCVAVYAVANVLAGAVVECPQPLAVFGAVTGVVKGTIASLVSDRPVQDLAWETVHGTSHGNA
jgi:hypothetical protein